MSVKSIAKWLLVFLAVFLLSSWSMAQTGCSQFNASFGPIRSGHSGIDHHYSGGHSASFEAHGSCTYQGASGQACNVTSSAQTVNPNYSDSGASTVIGPYYHQGGANADDGFATANGGKGATSNTIGAVSFKQCPILTSCAVSITFSGSGNGGGFTANFPPDAIWSDKQTYNSTCAGRTAPPVGCTGNCSGPGSPIVIATASTGFMQGFSDPQSDCVLFDLRGDGKPVCISWPKEDSGLAWLVLPDENGQVTSGAQLFGDHTPQAHHYNPTNPNGFLALAEYDMVENGGNLDAVIDKHDSVWKGKRKLRLWFDKHCREERGKLCTALPGELRPLEEYGIQNISLVYGQGASLLPDSNDLDQWKNQFKFCANMNVKAGKLQEATDASLACDVWVQQKQ